MCVKPFNGPETVQPEAYLATGGGSVIGYAKIANLLQAYEQSYLRNFVNVPVGKGKPIDRKLKPLQCSS